MNKLLSYSFFLTAMFPWVSFRLFDLDLQPYYIIFSMLVFIVFVNSKTPWTIYFVLLSALLSLVLVFAYGNVDFLAARAVLSGLSIFLASFSYFSLRKKYLSDILPFLILVNVVWLASGFIQLILSKDVLSFLLTVRTTDDRGVTGLAPEPTFYGMYLVLLSWLLLKVVNFRFNIKKVNILLLFNVCFVFFVARSSMAVLVVLIMVAIWFISGFFSSITGVVKVIVMCVGLGYFVISLPNILPDGSRMKKVVETALIGPEVFFYSDASANDRLRNIVFPIQLSFSSFFMPHGYHSFSIDSLKLEKEYSGYFWWGEASNKIMSGWGGVLYELGFLSFPLIFWCVFTLYRINDMKIFFFEVVSIFVVMITAMPLAIPIFSFIIMESHFTHMQKRA